MQALTGAGGAGWGGAQAVSRFVNARNEANIAATTVGQGGRLSLVRPDVEAYAAGKGKPGGRGGGKPQRARKAVVQPPSTFK